MCFVKSYRLVQALLSKNLEMDLNQNQCTNTDEKQAWPQSSG